MSFLDKILEKHRNIRHQLIGSLDEKNYLRKVDNEVNAQLKEWDRQEDGDNFNYDDIVTYKEDEEDKLFGLYFESESDRFSSFTYLLSDDYQAGLSPEECASNIIEEMKERINQREESESYDEDYDEEEDYDEDYDRDEF